jgi:excisionase family DNA binding protein
MDDNGYLTVGDVAEIMHVCRSWVYKNIELGGKDKLPCFRVGRMIRFRRKKIDKWMDAHEMGKAGK